MNNYTHRILKTPDTDITGNFITFLAKKILLAIKPGAASFLERILSTNLRDEINVARLMGSWELFLLFRRPVVSNNSRSGIKIKNFLGIHLLNKHNFNFTHGMWPFFKKSILFWYILIIISMMLVDKKWAVDIDFWVKK